MSTTATEANSSTAEGTHNPNPANARNCFCGVPSPLKVARTRANFGRRFYGCLNYEDPSSNCGFFVWLDGPTPDHLKALLTKYYLEMELYKQMYKKLLNERDTMLCQLTDLQMHCQDVGIELVDTRKECKTLEEQVNLGRRQNLWIALTCAALLWHIHA